MKHKCPVEGCAIMVQDSKLMCPYHWGLVPNPLAVAVYTEYRRAKRSEAHFDAMKKAIDAVNALKK